MDMSEPPATNFLIAHTENRRGLLLRFALGRRYVKSQGSAWIHDIIRIKMPFERAQHVHLLFAEMPLHPGRDHLADTVMVA